MWCGQVKSVNINLQNIKNLNQKQIQVEFTSESFDLKIFDFQQKNFRLFVPKLHSKINPKKSNIKIKQHYIFVNLVKDGAGSWTNIQFEKKFDALKNMDPKEDPQQGLFNMMKRMYEEGDDNMKKTIGEAWVKARESPQKYEK